MTHRSLSRGSDREILAAATDLLVSARDCSPDSAFDELIDVANRNHAGVVDTARRLVSVASSHRRSAVSLPREWRLLTAEVNG